MYLYVHVYTCMLSNLYQERELKRMSIAGLHYLNSSFSCGELPSLFSNNELEGLLQVLTLYWYICGGRVSSRFLQTEESMLFF